jgi:outer membrane protein OmpA-like peptidoglycan-associated protein
MKACNLSLCVALLLGTAVRAEEPAKLGAVISFVACPVYRDTNSGRKSGCWLATDPASGIRYEIGPSRTKPQIGREVLIEGRLSSEQQVCGSPVIAPAHASVLEGSCPHVMLPAEGYPGRRFVLAPGSVLPPTDTIRPPLPGPFNNKQWAIEFPFQSDFLQYQYSEVILDEVARYALASHPKQVHVTGYAVTEDLQVSAHHLKEPAALAQARAQMVALALRRLGVADGLLKVDWHTNPAAALIEDGLAQPSRRRVDIQISY